MYVLFRQNENGSDINKGKERLGELVISGGDTAKMFYLIEKALH